MNIKQKRYLSSSKTKTLRNILLTVFVVIAGIASLYSQPPRPSNTKRTRPLPTLQPTKELTIDKSANRIPAPENIKNKTSNPQTPTKNSARTSKNVTYVTIENSDTWYYDQDINAEAQILVGNVVFSHDGVYLYCDSAYFYEAKNSFDAYGNVLIQQGDTLFVYADELYYDGNIKLARLRYNVLMDNLTATLETDSLNYDRAKNVGYYFDGGVIRDSLNTLVSETGHYYPSNNTAVFRHKVKLENNRFVMNSDTLRYNTDSKIASIVGPTTILYEKETKIYSEYGWYNTQNEQSKLLLNSYIEHNDGKRLEADTLFYDKKNGKGEGFKNVHLIDLKKKVSLNGQYGYYIEKNERGIVTDSAIMMEYSSPDTLFLHSDTLRTYSVKYIPDSLPADTIKSLKDSVYKIFEGFHNVRFYRNNIQGVCDSAIFSTQDSVLTMLNKPIVWSEKRQITGDTIRIFQKDEKLNRILINDKAFATDSVEQKYFNQLSGKQMIGYIKNDSLRKIDILGNAQSVYFFEDKADGSLIGMATTESPMMNIYVNDKNTLDKIIVKTKPSGNLYPINQIDQSKIYLPNYSWQIALRPLSKTDIFRRTKNAIKPTNTTSEDKKTTGKKTTRRDKTGKNNTPHTVPSLPTATTSTTMIRPSGFDNPDIDNMDRPKNNQTKK